METNICNLTLNIEIVGDMLKAKQKYNIDEIKIIATDIVSKKGKVIVQMEYCNAEPDCIKILNTIEEVNTFFLPYLDEK